jgi:D-alanine-D-alanine ligase
MNANRKKALKVLVLSGGISEERAVSLASGKAIFDALKKLGHDASVMDPATGRYLVDKSGNYLLEKDTESSSKIALRANDARALAEVITAEKQDDIDLVFIGLHGGAGENGTIQAILDMAGVKYTGSGMLASALAMNKALTKRLVRSIGVRTPEWMLIRAGDKRDLERRVPEIADGFDYPLIIKPNDSGSTVGLSLVKKDTQTLDALNEAYKFSKEILVEEYVKGREITAAVLNGRSLPLVEIVPSGELYDYRCKYTKGGSNYICPAEIEDEIAEEIKESAARAYNLVGCRGLARVDFILNTEGRPYFLEINTIPGMTELSLAPMAAREAGMDFDELIDEICRTTMESHLS